MKKNRGQLVKENNLKTIIAFNKLEKHIDSKLVKLCSENKTAENDESIF